MLQRGRPPSAGRLMVKHHRLLLALELKGQLGFLFGGKGLSLVEEKPQEREQNTAATKPEYKTLDFRKKARGLYTSGFIWVYFLFLKETYSTLTWPKSTSPSHPDFSVKSALPFHFGACCQTHRASEGLQGRFGWTDSVKRVLASIQ